MGSQRRVRVESVCPSGQGRRVPGALSLLAIGVCILVAALLFGVVAPPAQATGATGIIDWTVTTGQRAAGATGSISGKVTAADGGAGLFFIYVDAVRKTGSGWGGGVDGNTDAQGNYTLSGLAAGNYRVEFDTVPSDIYGDYVYQCYNNKATLELGDDIAVTAGATTSGIDAALAAAGQISGTVTAVGGAGLANMQVALYQPSGSGGWNEVKSAFTNDVGAYTIGLPTGSYRVQFRGGASFLDQYYDNKPTIDAADEVAVTVGVTTSGIDATLVAAAVPTVTLRLSGLSGGAIKLGKSVAASGAVTPASLAGKVTLTVQLKKGSAWIKATTASATITSAGVYSWKYKPAKKGAYRMQAAIAKTDAHAGAATAWLAFQVK